jgi:hypothetical protein
VLLTKVLAQKMASDGLGMGCNFARFSNDHAWLCMGWNLSRLAGMRCACVVCITSRHGVRELVRSPVKSFRTSIARCLHCSNNDLDQHDQERVELTQHSGWCQWSLQCRRDGDAAARPWAGRGAHPGRYGPALARTGARARTRDDPYVGTDEMAGESHTRE